MVAATDKARTGDVLIRELIAFDGGNRFIQYRDPSGDVKTIAATITELEDWQDAVGTDRTVLVELGDKRYLIGSPTGTPIYKAEKSELASIAILAALEPNPGCNVLSVDVLRILCTDSRNAKYKEMAASIQSLEWMPSDRTFKRNGQTISICTIRKVELVDECRPAFLYASRNQWFKRPELFNGVLDIGGGDSTARIFNSDGTIQREYDKVLPGTKQLATSIAAAIQKDFQYTPDPSVIMDAIADGSYSFEYNFQPVSFQKQFERELSKWTDALRQEIGDSWNSLLSSGRVGEVLIVGGSAPLLQSFEVRTGGRFRVVKHEAIANFSSVINVYGMSNA